jgi:chromosome segregation ATPase
VITAAGNGPGAALDGSTMAKAPSSNSDLPAPDALKAQIKARLGRQSMASLERAAGLKKGSLSRLLSGKQKLKSEHLDALVLGLNGLGQKLTRDELLGHAPPAPSPNKGPAKKPQPKASPKSASKDERTAKDLSREITGLKKELAKGEKKLAEWEKRKEQWQADAEAWKKSEAQLRKDLENAEKSTDRLRAELATMSQALGASHEEQKGLLSGLENERQSRMDLEKQVSAQEAIKAEGQRLAETMTAERDAAMDRLAKEKAASHSAWKHISELEEEVSESGDLLKEERKKLARALHEVNRARADREKLTEQVKKLTGALRQFKANFKVLKEKNADLRQRMEMTTEGDAVRSERFELEKRLAEKGAALEAARDMISQWRTYAKQRDLRVSQLKAALKKIQGKSAPARPKP